MLEKMIKTLTITVFIFAIFLLLNTVCAASDFTMQNLNFNAVLNNDGSMHVTEFWDININGETNTLFKEYDLKNGQYDITNIKVKDLTSSKDFSRINSLMYHVTTDSYYAMENEDGLFEIAWGVNKDNGERKYAISYTVENAITVYNDCAELYWQFLGKSFDASIDSVNGTLTLPANVSNIDNLRVWAHGALNGEITRTNEKTINFNVTPYFKGYGVEVRTAILEPNMFLLSNNREYKDQLSNILSEEQEWANVANKQRENEKAKQNAIKWAIIIASMIISALYIYRGIKNIKQLKETKKIGASIKLDYYRDIPNEKESNPTEAAFLYYYDKTKMRAHVPKIISSIMLDLSLKKFLQFEIKMNEKNKEEIHIKVLEEKDGTELKESEKILYQIFQTIAQKETKSFTMKDFEKYAKEHSTKLLSSIDRMSTVTEKEQEENGNFDKAKEKVKNSWLGKGIFAIIFAIICGIMIAAISEEFYLKGTLWTAIVVLASSLFYMIISVKLAGKFSGLTQNGIDEKEQWQGLKKYMEDFSLLNEREVPELMLWEKYLVYATTFGIADKVLQQLKVKYPEFSNDEYMRNTTYLYLMTNSSLNTTFIQSMNTSVSRAYQASVAASSSSSGGGYGGGFSGGGGGRRRRRPEEAADRT